MQRANVEERYARLLLISAMLVLWLGGVPAANAIVNPSPFGSHIICRVYTDLNESGSPIPRLAGGDCPDEPSLPPPAPAPSPAPPSPEPSPQPPPPTSTPQCADGEDNDGDGLTDMNDPACHTDGNAGNPDSYDSALDDESVFVPQCRDGIDNDGDALADGDDPGCEGMDDANEADTESAPDEGGSPPSPNPSPSPSPSGGGGPPIGLFGSVVASAPAPAGAVLGAATSVAPYTAEEIAACDTYLTAFIKLGQENDGEQVARLQRFLNDFEGHDLVVSGVYDGATLVAVHAFQAKYAVDILKPWGIKGSTGYVYLTTRKKVNEIFCNFTRDFSLTAEERQKVEETRRSIMNAEGTTGSRTESRQEPSDDSDDTSRTATETPEAGEGVVQNVLDILRNIFHWRE